jgi:hypothetical protein
MTSYDTSDSCDSCMSPVSASKHFECPVIYKKWLLPKWRLQQSWWHYSISLSIWFYLQTKITSHAKRATVSCHHHQPCFVELRLVHHTAASPVWLTAMSQRTRGQKLCKRRRRDSSDVSRNEKLNLVPKQRLGVSKCMIMIFRVVLCWQARRPTSGASTFPLHTALFHEHRRLN